MIRKRSAAMPIKIVLTLSLFLTYANLAIYAADGSGGHGSLLSLEMLFKGINFLILLLLLHRFARKPIVGMLSKAATNSRESTDSAKEALEAAKKQLKEYQAKLSNLEQELEERQKTAMEVIEEDKKKIIEDAELHAKKLEEQSKYRIEQDLSKAKAEIREYIANEAVKLAESIISNEIEAKDKKSLVEAYTNSLKETV